MFAQRRYPSHPHSPIVLVRKNLVDLWRTRRRDPFKIRDVAWRGMARSRTIAWLRTFSTMTANLLALSDWLTTLNLKEIPSKAQACLGGRCSTSWKRVGPSCWSIRSASSTCRVARPTSKTRCGLRHWMQVVTRWECIPSRLFDRWRRAPRECVIRTYPCSTALRARPLPAPTRARPAGCRSEWCPGDYARAARRWMASPGTALASSVLRDWRLAASERLQGSQLPRRELRQSHREQPPAGSHQSSASYAKLRN